MTVATSPANPVVGEAVELSTNIGIALHVAADATVLRIDAVPSASTVALGYVLPTGVGNTELTLYDVAEMGGVARFTPDVAGEYSITLFSLRLQPTTIAGQLTRWRFAGKEEATISVGGYADLPIVLIGGAGGSLRLTITGNTIRGAELRQFSTEAARLAALQSAGVAALGDLVGATVPGAFGDFLERVEDLRVNFEAHILGSSWHVGADTVNAPTLSAPTTQAAGIAVLNMLRELSRLHFAEENRTQPFHTNNDPASVPITSEASSLASAIVLLADLRTRGYSRHRAKGTAATPPVHTILGGDTTNTLAGNTLLEDAIVAFLDALVDPSPPLVAGESEGLSNAAHMGGFAIQR